MVDIGRHLIIDGIYNSETHGDKHNNRDFLSNYLEEVKRNEKMKKFSLCIRNKIFCFFFCKILTKLFCSVTFFESFNTSFRVKNFLLTGVEWVAV